MHWTSGKVGIAKGSAARILTRLLFSIRVRSITVEFRTGSPGVASRLHTNYAGVFLSQLVLHHCGPTAIFTSC